MELTFFLAVCVCFGFVFKTEQVPQRHLVVAGQCLHSVRALSLLYPLCIPQQVRWEGSQTGQLSQPARGICMACNITLSNKRWCVGEGWLTAKVAIAQRLPRD